MRQLTTRRGDVALKGEASAARADFLLLHAGGERRTVWRPVMARLLRSGLGAAAYDQRGHGESGGGVEDGLDIYAADVAAMLSAHPETRILVGASLGGLAATLSAAAETVQARLAGLVLVDVVPAPNAERSRSYLQAQGDHVAASPLVGDILSRAEELSAAAAKLRLPLLLVRAGVGWPLVDADVFALKGLCPQLQVAHVDGASHLIARDAPLALADRLIDFEQSHAVRRRRPEPEGPASGTQR